MTNSIIQSIKLELSRLGVGESLDNQIGYYGITVESYRLNEEPEGLIVSLSDGSIYLDYFANELLTLLKQTKTANLSFDAPNNIWLLMEPATIEFNSLMEVK